MKRMTKITYPILALFALACLALAPQARAVCQEGCLTNENTVLGDDTLLNNTGTDNTAIGFAALISNTTGPRTRPLVRVRCSAIGTPRTTRQSDLTRCIVTRLATPTQRSVLKCSRTAQPATPMWRRVIKRS